MTIDEAIQELKTDSCYECSYGYNSIFECTDSDCKYKEAINLAIKALECSVAYLNGLTTCSDPTDDPNGLKNVPVSVAAQKLGKSEQFVRVGLQRNILPFGVAVQLSSRFSYHISPKLLNEYIGG